MSSFLGRSQVSSYFHGDSKDFVELKNRPLIVELLEEDEKVLRKLDKPKRADELEAYKKMIKLYNEDIVVYAKKYWILNTNIEVKKQSEIESLKKTKNKSYAVLRNLRLKDIDFDFRSKLYVNAFVYTRIESNNEKPDSKAYMPVFSKNPDILLYESDYKFSLELLQANIEYIISNKKTINSEDYIKAMAKGNCSTIQNKTILIKESLLYEKETKENCIKAYNGKCKFVSDEEFNRAFLDKDKDKVCMFSIPWEIGKGSIGPLNQSFIMSFKTIVDCETSKILYQFLPTGFAAFGQNISYYVVAKDLENIKKCK